HMACLDGVPAVKCGPGRSERSHTPDEYVLESEILEGARFYARLVRAYAELREREEAACAAGGTGPSRSTSACCATPPARTIASTNASWPTTCAPRSRTRRCSRKPA